MVLSQQTCQKLRRYGRVILITKSRTKVYSHVQFPSK